MSILDSHCSYCGYPYDAAVVEVHAWPRSCSNCDNPTFRNPIPVAVVIQPIENGIVLVRRGIAPRIGKWALPGGYVDYGETWQEAAVRELQEETGIQVQPEGMTLLDVLPSSNRVTMLIFGVGPKLAGDYLTGFMPNEEVSEIMVCRQEKLAGVDWAFSIHGEMGRRWFESK